MKLLKEIIQTHLKDDITPVITKWAVKSANEEFKKGIIQLTLSENESKGILNSYADKMNEVKDGSGYLFTIKGAAIGTVLKKIMKATLTDEYKPFLDNVDLRIVVRKSNTNGNIILYIFFRGKFYNLVSKVVYHYIKNDDLIKTLQKMNSHENTAHVICFDANKAVKVNSKKAILNKAFVEDIVVDTSKDSKVKNWTSLLISRKLSIKKYVEVLLKVKIPENIDYIVYFTVDTFNFFDNNVDTLDFRFEIRKTVN